MSCIKRQMLHSVHIYLIILGGIMAMMIMQGAELGNTWFGNIHMLPYVFIHALFDTISNELSLPLCILIKQFLPNQLSSFIRPYTSFLVSQFQHLEDKLHKQICNKKKYGKLLQYLLQIPVYKLRWF